MTLRPWICHDHCPKATTEERGKCSGSCGGKFVVRWRDSAKKKHRDEFRFEKRSDARKRQDLIMRQFQNNALGVAAEMTLRDASVIFRKHIGPKLANDLMREHCDVYWKQINASLGDHTLNHLTYTHVVDYWESFLKRGCKASTANRSIMWICNLYERFRMWNAMVPEMMPEKVSLPETNPVKVAKEYLGRKRSELPFKRKRVLSREELQAMKGWCLANYPNFWEDIKMAMLTSLRKSDLLALQGGERIAGIQGKTQRPFDLPLTATHQVRSEGMRWRWDQLRIVLKWNVRGTPLHTTWHDLRHCGPTMLAEMGYSSKIIQEILGHATEQQSKTYTNVRAHALAPALAALQQELSSI